MAIPRPAVLLRCRFSRWSRSIATQPNFARSRASNAAIIKVPKVDLDTHLRSQDPENRIVFSPQRVKPEQCLHRYGSQLKIDEFSSCAHLIPFWTIIFLCDVRRGFKLPGTGWAQNGRPRQSFTDIGCSIAAVPENHWCSGLVLTDDLRMMIQQHQLGGGNALRATSKGYNFAQLGYGGLDHSSINPKRAPLFAWSYPELSPDELFKISTLPEYRDVSGTETWAFNEIPEVVAIPTYRIAYKVDIQGGRTAYVDGCYDLESSHQVMLAHRHGRVSSNWSWNSQTAIKFNARNLFEGFHTTHIAPQPLLPAQRSSELSEILVKAMQRNPVDWTDPKIIPAIGGSFDGVLLASHADDRIFGRTDKALPEPLVTPSPSPKPKPTPRKSTAKPSPKPSSPPLTTEIPQAPKTPRPETPHPHPPRPHTVHHHAPHHRLTLSRTTRTIRPTPPRPIPTSSESKRFKLQPQRVSDPHGYYRLLGLTPTTDFLDPEQSSETLAKLSAHRRALAMIYHTDVMGGSSHEQMARINAAFDGLKTIESRRKYSNS